MPELAGYRSGRIAGWGNAAGLRRDRQVWWILRDMRSFDLDGRRSARRRIRNRAHANPAGRCRQDGRLAMRSGASSRRRGFQRTTPRRFYRLSLPDKCFPTCPPGTDNSLIRPGGASRVAESETPRAPRPDIASRAGNRHGPCRQSVVRAFRCLAKTPELEARAVLGTVERRPGHASAVSVAGLRYSLGRIRHPSLRDLTRLRGNPPIREAGRFAIRRSGQHRQVVASMARLRKTIS